MTDPRCNCGEDDCPICSAPAHQPWQPQPGQTPILPQITLEELQERLERQRTWERAETIRRVLLMLLMSLVGGMIGGMVSVISILHYLD